MLMIRHSVYQLGAIGMIDLQNETILTLCEAARKLPNKPNLTTLSRWRTRGCRGVRLETLLLGGRRVTSSQALERFFTAVTAAADGKANAIEPQVVAAAK